MKICLADVDLSAEHASTIESDHPSMRQGATCIRNQGYKIIDVTPEVIRDYLEEAVSDTMDDIQPIDATPPTNTPQTTGDLDDPSRNLPLDVFRSLEQQNTPLSAQSEGGIALPTPLIDAPDLFLSPQYSDPAFEDGIFLPGSQYQELHATLRSRIIDTARSTVPSRIGSPEVNMYPAESEAVSMDSAEDEEFRRLAQLSLEHEFVLWQNYIDEVAGMYSLPL